tara:strand:+ start:43 stop:858 length:816 start_codon:yes stop_codon:yes gene_type:complete
MSRQGKLAALASTGVTKAELDLLDGVTSTTAELNITDGVTATAAEINLIDGGTARGTTAVADGDGFLTNDGGTMRMTTVDTLATYMGTKIGGGYEFISSTDISSAATYAFTAFDASKYDHYQVVLSNIVPATDAQGLYMLTSTDGGTNYINASNSYSQQSLNSVASNDATSVTRFNNFTVIGITGVNGVVGTATGEVGGVTGILTVFNPHNTGSVTTVSGTFGFSNSSGQNRINTIWGQRIVAEDVTGLRFNFGSGNIASGQINVYGMVNS